ncbi:hypothetical protein [Cupriavidus sp. AcVe19-1a]|uniref:hypothetical protein n=1 Tax=Cupriavidus sp. AcVe19-1a TaxID=2821359 RepID=UPI001AE10A25|nr:hypothetical protein [Cupriavidus sp. AcVe19-1a]MBP0631977.1 hypothetical protein [Cupriavidus sp. AcVe19-1a]
MTSAAVRNSGSDTFIRRGSGSATAGGSPASILRLVWSKTHYDPAPFALQPAKRALDSLRALDDNWDGFGSDKPKESAISAALGLLPELYSTAERLGGWSLPDISANEDGEVVFEWRSGRKKLALFIRDDAIDFLQAWGTHVEHDMSDGTLDTNDFADLWTWLCN